MGQLRYLFRISYAFLQNSCLGSIFLSRINTAVTPDWRPYCVPTATQDVEGTPWSPKGRGENASRRRGDPKDAEGRRATAFTLDMFKVNAEVRRPERVLAQDAVGSP